MSTFIFGTELKEEYTILRNLKVFKQYNRPCVFCIEIKLTCNILVSGVHHHVVRGERKTTQ